MTNISQSIKTKELLELNIYYISTVFVFIKRSTGHGKITLIKNTILMTAYTEYIL